MEGEPEWVAGAQRAADAIGKAGSTLAGISAAFESARPALKELAEQWRRCMIQRERTLRERLGIWRYLSAEWWQLRRYVRELGSND